VNGCLAEEERERKRERKQTDQAYYKGVGGKLTEACKDSRGWMQPLEWLRGTGGGLLISHQGPGGEAAVNLHKRGRGEGRLEKLDSLRGEGKGVAGNEQSLRHESKAISEPAAIISSSLWPARLLQALPSSPAQTCSPLMQEPNKKGII
jgi:hypothetical protein